jgi:hypothetical protein
MKMSATSQTIPNASYQLYKDYLILTRFTRSWWWATVIDSSGVELKRGIFCHAEGKSSAQEAIERAQQDIDLFDRLN